MHRARVRTLQALVAGHPSLGAHAQLNDILAEFDEVHAVRKIRRDSRKRLLEVLHSTRALDTTLAAFVGHYGCRAPGSQPPKTLGQYLRALRDHGVTGLNRLAEPHRHRFQAAIADRRNHYMHQASAFPPDDVEIQTLLSEMATCLTVVTRL